MTPEAIITVSAAVVALVQLLKWGGFPDRAGPVAVLALAALGIGLWGYSVGFARTDLFGYFAGWVTVSTSAAGVFGFTRAASTAVTATKAPPAGAAQNPTVDNPDTKAAEMARPSLQAEADQH